MIFLHRVLNVSHESGEITNKRSPVDVREARDVGLQRPYQSNRGVDRRKATISIRHNSVVGKFFRLVEETPANRGRQKISRSTCQQSVAGGEALDADDDIEWVSEKVEIPDPFPIAGHSGEEPAVDSGDCGFQPVFTQSFGDVSSDDDVDSLLIVDPLEMCDDFVDPRVDCSSGLAVKFKGRECSVDECRSCHDLSMPRSSLACTGVELNR
jgi:hypothetical protein